ncbi:translation protein SH3-like domain-containing protein [Xylaria nigripes]|nr:translation protein SH3-like domain-containing protein [Xylaria nigripes]
MLTQTARPPLGAWRGVLRRARQQRPMAFSRTMATETTSSSSPPPPPPPPAKRIIKLPTPHIHNLRPQRPTSARRFVFAIYPRVPSSRETTPSVLAAYHEKQIRRLDPKGVRTQLFSKSNVDSVKPGDVLQVTTRRGEPFSGVCISIRRAGVDSAICLRNHLTKVGVEMWYKIYSPNVLGIDIVWRRPKRARRARLTYMRKPKHDMGNVDHLVANWRRSRNVFKSKGKVGKTAVRGREGKKK